VPIVDPFADVADPVKRGISGPLGEHVIQPSHHPAGASYHPSSGVPTRRKDLGLGRLRPMARADSLVPKELPVP
jgi:hypothetical protein